MLKELYSSAIAAPSVESLPPVIDNGESHYGTLTNPTTKETLSEVDRLVSQIRANIKRGTKANLGKGVLTSMDMMNASAKKLEQRFADKGFQNNDLEECQAEYSVLETFVSDTNAAFCKSALTSELFLDAERHFKTLDSRQGSVPTIVSAAEQGIEKMQKALKLANSFIADGTFTEVAIVDTVLIIKSVYEAIDPEISSERVLTRFESALDEISGKSEESAQPHSLSAEGILAKLRCNGFIDVIAKDSESVPRSLTELHADLKAIVNGRPKVDAINFNAAYDKAIEAIYGYVKAISLHYSTVFFVQNVYADLTNALEEVALAAVKALNEQDEDKAALEEFALEDSEDLSEIELDIPAEDSVALEALLTDLSDVYATIRSDGGVCKTSIESLIALGVDVKESRFPVTSYTEAPSSTNESVALEGVLETVNKGIKAAAQAVFDFIRKVYRAIMNLLVKDKGDKVKSAAKAQETIVSAPKAAQSSEGIEVNLTEMRKTVMEDQSHRVDELMGRMSSVKQKQDYLISDPLLLKILMDADYSKGVIGEQRKFIDLLEYSERVIETLEDTVKRYHAKGAEKIDEIELSQLMAALAKVHDNHIGEADASYDRISALANEAHKAANSVQADGVKFAEIALRAAKVELDDFMLADQKKLAKKMGKLLTRAEKVSVGVYKIKHPDFAKEVSRILKLCSKLSATEAMCARLLDRIGNKILGAVEDIADTITETVDIMDESERLKVALKEPAH